MTTETPTSGTGEQSLVNEDDSTYINPNKLLNRKQTSTLTLDSNFSMFIRYFSFSSSSPLLNYICLKMF